MFGKIVKIIEAIQMLNIEISVLQLETIFAKGVSEIKKMDDNGNGKISVIELIDYIADAIVLKKD